MLEKAGIVSEDANGLLSASQKFFYKRQFGEDLVRTLGFSFSAFGSTLVHNALLHRRTDLTTEERKHGIGRLERAVFSEHLADRGIVELKAWVRDAGPRFLAEAHEVIGKDEIRGADRGDVAPHVVGVGVYYFEED